MEKKLLKRLRLLSLILIVCGTGFFSYSFFYEKPSLIEIETAGLDFTDLQDGPPTEKMLFASGFIFYSIGFITLLFAAKKLKRHPHN